jgi:predicted nucleic acid-binding protein
MTLVDTNVISDIFNGDAVWLDWSVAALDERRLLGPLLINEVVYAELSVRMPSRAALDEEIARLKCELARTPLNALFLAGKTFHRYRASGGIRTGVLPDFYIGAHAEVAGMAILTRDPGRFRTYFPAVELITP